MSTESWYLVCYRAGSRDNVYKAQAFAERRSLSTFCPMVRRLIQRKDCSGSRLIIEPLFQGYMFIELNPEIIHPSTLEQQCSGISHFVRYGNELRPVPDSLLETLMTLPLCHIETRKKISNPHTLSRSVQMKIDEIVSCDNKSDRTAMFLALAESIKH